MPDQPQGPGKIRIGSGEVRVPGALDVYRLRVEFLERLRDLRPAVMADLRQLVNLPASEQRQAIVDWAIRHNLVTKGHPPRWIVQTAALTLKAWAEQPEFRGWSHAAASDWTPLSPEEMRIQIDLEWDPTLDIREQVIERVIAAANARMDEIERFAIERGAVKSEWKREPLHLNWLVRFQVNGESPDQIAAQPAERPYTVSAAAVKQALRETAQLIGLSLRPMAKRGRPRKH